MDKEMRNLLDVCDFSVQELNKLIAIAEDIAMDREKYAHALSGKKLATLFFEPSTRTRLSFEAAMLELGGSVLGFSEASSSSASKGECVGDTVRVVSNYADIIAMRHPIEGAALAAAEKASIPIINAGDGGHCHPTQTLADLLTIHREIGRLHHLRIGLCGDLLYGRTVHSLINAMLRYEGISFVLISPDELKLPAYTKQAMIESGADFSETDSLEDSIADLDVLYMTRVQRERFLSAEAYERVKNCYVLTRDILNSAKPEMRVLHPLPRVNEIAKDVDDDPRAAYFRQTLNGKLMRMALLLTLTSPEYLSAPSHLPVGKPTDKICGNSKCITNNEVGFARKSVIGADGVERCLYCEHIL